MENYFDVDSLAKYLHLIPDQVKKMAERGKLPGTRVGGEWRFQRQEIFHWFEERIGISDELQLRQYQDLLDRHEQEVHEFEITIQSLLPLELIWLNCPARTKNALIRDFCDFAMNQGYLWDAEKMSTAIQNREQLNSTALENGVALLHSRRPQVDNFEAPFLGLAITPSGIPFGGPRGSLTDIYFLIASDSDAFHLKLLTRLSRMINQTEVLDQLRASTTVQDAKRILVEAEDLLT
jgi:PTS system nitrogen regulatory IIA component